MRKNEDKKVIADGAKLQLPYYNNYPDDEPIIKVLSEEEESYFKRGRNIGHTNVPKSATVSEYRTATGMEVLFGFLHLSERNERINELFTIGYINVADEDASAPN